MTRAEDLQGQVDDWQGRAELAAAEAGACDASLGVCRSQLDDVAQQLDYCHSVNSNCTGVFVGLGEGQGLGVTWSRWWEGGRAWGAVCVAVQQADRWRSPAWPPRADNLVTVSNRLVDCQRDRTTAQRALSESNRQLRSCESGYQAALARGC